MTRFFIVLLAAGIAVLQWQLWAGRTSWDRLRELEAQLAAQKRLNAELRAGNEDAGQLLVDVAGSALAVARVADLHLVDGEGVVFSGDRCFYRRAGGVAVEFAFADAEVG